MPTASMGKFDTSKLTSSLDQLYFCFYTIWRSGDAWSKKGIGIFGFSKLAAICHNTGWLPISSIEPYVQYKRLSPDALPIKSITSSRLADDGENNINEIMKTPDLHQSDYLLSNASQPHDKKLFRSLTVHFCTARKFDLLFPYSVLSKMWKYHGNLRTGSRAGFRMHNKPCRWQLRQHLINIL